MTIRLDQAKIGKLDLVLTIDGIVTALVKAKLSRKSSGKYTCVIGNIIRNYVHEMERLEAQEGRVRGRPAGAEPEACSTTGSGDRIAEGAMGDVK